MLPAGALVAGPPGPDLGEELPEAERWDWWARSPLTGSSLRLLLTVAELTVGAPSPEIAPATHGTELGAALRKLLQERPHREELVRRLTLGGSIPPVRENRRSKDGYR